MRVLAENTRTETMTTCAAKTRQTTRYRDSLPCVLSRCNAFPAGHMDGWTGGWGNGSGVRDGAKQ